MLSLARIALNRITCPRLSLAELFGLCAGLGITGVELRNDMPGGKISDDLSPDRVRSLSAEHGVRILTVNALQQFNLASLITRKVREVRELADLARAIGCEAVVLCPNNDPRDDRPAERRYAETVQALQAFAPVFEQSGLTAFIEPLGFTQSSLASLLTAQRAIRESGFSGCRIVYDTFHHFLGPDTVESLDSGFDVNLIGIVHASGADMELPVGDYRDGHRGLVFAGDRLRSREQVEALQARGYRGYVSFEPFSPRVQDLSLDELTAELERSIAYLTGVA